MAMDQAGAALSADDLLRLFGGMLRIRRVEERLAEDFKAGRLPIGVHLYIGQEAVAVGVCDHLTERDWVASTHRGHGHFLAKGGAIAPMLAEIHAKATGICKGMGGTMHVADFAKGILGANGIVGAGIAMATGAALHAQLEGQGHVAVAFFGDGAAAQGSLAESLNMAALWRLPVIFVCENNGYSEFSATDTVTAGRICDRAAPFGVPGVRVDGNDVAAVWTAARGAVARARAGDGPSLIEAMTYRLHGHIEAEASFLSEPYRTAEEIARWRNQDPLDRARALLADAGFTDQAALEALDAALQREIEAAIAAAEAGPPADPALPLALMSVVDA